jgi:hypothetical protein
LVFLCVVLHTAFRTASFLGIAVTCILSMWPSHRIRWFLINLTIFSPLCLLIHHFVEFCIIRVLSLVHIFFAKFSFQPTSTLLLPICNQLHTGNLPSLFNITVMPGTGADPQHKKHPPPKRGLPGAIPNNGKPLHLWHPVKQRTA